jgi:hypothetical protein
LIFSTRDQTALGRVLMPGKYEALTEALRAAFARGQDTVELGFDQVADLVGGLPRSADIRQWWANSSQSQALAWRDAGFHVEQVYLDRQRVRFARGQRGGSYDRGRGPRSATSRRTGGPVPRGLQSVTQWTCEYACSGTTAAR